MTPFNILLPCYRFKVAGVETTPVRAGRTACALLALMACVVEFFTVRYLAAPEGVCNLMNHLAPTVDADGPITALVCGTWPHPAPIACDYPAI
jgi:hypothetical protein